MPAVSSDILIWARESAGLSVEEAAHKLQLKDTATSAAKDKLEKYESEQKAPSRPLLLKMAKVYRKPLLSFYLDKPPAIGDRGQDFRTLPDGRKPEDDFLVDTLVRNIKSRQSLLREALVDEESEPVDIVGSATLDMPHSELAAHIEEHLKFDLSEFRKQRHISGSFKYLRSLTEQSGVFVILAGNLGTHHSAIDPETFRGFVLSDDYAPLIVINDRDAKSAWSFTLIHELAHLWLGLTGLSGLYAENKIERYCNDVASHMLLPELDLKKFEPDFSNFEALVGSIGNFALSCKVSSSMIAYRLYRSDRLSAGQWRKISGYFKEQWIAAKAKEREKNKEGSGPSYYVVRKAKLGDRLLEIAQQMTKRGTLTTTKAAMLLGVKPIKLNRLFDTANGG